jgi:hypothetical protein
LYARVQRFMASVMLSRMASLRSSSRRKTGYSTASGVAY